MRDWVEEANNMISGMRIKEVRWLTQEEQDSLGWSRSAPVIVLQNGEQLFCSADDEGNDAGALFTTNEDLPVLPTGV